ncbi:MAG: hypothetical protein C4536_01785 [Actinobacteria bacterium]|jgi:hypothetical protein|nr:MAG: hypothetical protein C4536_01785 [Actinomycetota bacterium]
MRRRIIVKTGVCLAAVTLLLFSMMGLCMAGGVLEDTPVGDALDKLDEVGGQIIDILTPGDSVETQADVSGSGDTSTGVPVPDLGSALDPGAIPGADALTGALDPANVPGLDTLTGALDPAAIPGLDSLPGIGDLSSGSLPSLPGMDGVPELPGFPAIDPMQVLQIIDGENQLFVVLSLDDIAEARLGLGKNLEKAPLLEIQAILFEALAAEGSLGIKKIDDNAFLVPVELYLKYMAGDEGWKEIFDLVLPLELSFPGAGMVPDGVQMIIDALYKYILKPILSLLPIYHEIEPETVPETVEPSVIPPTQVEGEVVGNNAGGSGDHLPFTGAEITVLLIIIVSLAVGCLLLRRLDKTVRRKAG